MLAHPGLGPLLEEQDRGRGEALGGSVLLLPF